MFKRSKKAALEEGHTNNIWNKHDFAMCGLGEKSRFWATLKHFGRCIKRSKQRIVRGYADSDIWNMYGYLQTLLPDMLEYLKNHRSGSPGYLGEKLQTPEELEANRKRGGGGTVHFMREIPEYAEISEKHMAEEMKLEQYRRECKDEVMDLMKEHFFSLWD